MNPLIMRWSSCSLRRTTPLGDITIIHPFDLQIRRGEWIAIVAPHSQGKTQLMHIMAGHVAPTSGRVWWDDQDVTHRRHHQRGIHYRDIRHHPPDDHTSHHAIMMWDEPLAVNHYREDWHHLHRERLVSRHHTWVYTSHVTPPRHLYDRMIRIDQGRITEIQESDELHDQSHVQ